MEEIIAMFVAGFVKNSETIIMIILAMYAGLTIVLAGCALFASTLPPPYAIPPIDEFRSRFLKARIAPCTRARGLGGETEPNFTQWVILLAACFLYQLTYYPGDYFGDQVIYDIGAWVGNLDIKIKIFLGLTSVAVISYDYLTLPIYCHPNCGGCGCCDHRLIKDDKLRALLFEESRMDLIVRWIKERISKGEPAAGKLQSNTSMKNPLLSGC